MINVKIHPVTSPYIQSIKINNCWTVAIDKCFKVVIIKEEFFVYYPIQYTNSIIGYDFEPTKQVRRQVEWMFSIANKLKQFYKK